MKREILCLSLEMTGGENDGDEDAVSAPDDEATQKRVQLVFRGVERAAAGAPLADIRQ